MNDNTWNKMFRSLQQFHELHGHCLVPENYEMTSLRAWTEEQRKKHFSLTNDQKLQLNDLGFSWTANDIKWEKVFLRLKAFHKVNGHCFVSRNHEDKTLANWVQFQRVRLKYLPFNRKKKLDDLNFSWTPHEEKWEENYLLLCEFHKSHGHFNVTRKNPLSTWIATQRSQKEHLSQERKEKLNSIDFVWNDLQDRWETQFQKLKQYKNRHGHCQVLKKEDSKLCRWVIKQRIKKNNLKLHQIKKLNDLGFSWCPSDENWEKMFLRLTEFKKIHGHCDVPQDFKDDPTLGTWVSTQRCAKIYPERKERLNAIGFNWKVKNVKRAA